MVMIASAVNPQRDARALAGDRCHHAQRDDRLGGQPWPNNAHRDGRARRSRLVVWKRLVQKMRWVIKKKQKKLSGSDRESRTFCQDRAGRPKREIAGRRCRGGGGRAVPEKKCVFLGCTFLNRGCNKN
jgi:hypothetical protein